MTITGHQFIDYGNVSITIMTTDTGHAYTLATNVANGRCDETLIYPNGRTRPLDVNNPADAAMTAVLDYLDTNFT